jgi:hypothetical protein
MSQARAELDRKITELEARAHELTPRAVAKSVAGFQVYKVQQRPTAFETPEVL